MRLINADALKQEIRKGTRYYVRVWDPKGREKWEMEKDLSLKEIDEIIDNAPTIDAVEVVRCKDCKHFDGSYPMCCRFEEEFKPDGYCSYGEKKEVEE